MFVCLFVYLFIYLFIHLCVYFFWLVFEIIIFWSFCLQSRAVRSTWGRDLISSLLAKVGGQESCSALITFWHLLTTVFLWQVDRNSLHCFIVCFSLKVNLLVTRSRKTASRWKMFYGIHWLTGQEDVISESVTGLNSCRIWCDALGQVTSSDHSVIFLLFCRGVEDNSEDSSPGLAWKRGSSEHPMQGIARLLKKLKGEMHWNLDKGIHYLGPICWGIQDKSIHMTWDGSCATRLFPDVSEWRLPSFSRPSQDQKDLALSNGIAHHRRLCGKDGLAILPMSRQGFPWFPCVNPLFAIFGRQVGTMQHLGSLRGFLPLAWSLSVQEKVVDWSGAATPLARSKDPPRELAFELFWIQDTQWDSNVLSDFILCDC